MSAGGSRRTQRYPPVVLGLRTAIVLTTGALLAAACGGGGADPTPEEAEAMSTLFDATLTGNEQECLLAGLLSSEIAPRTIIDGAMTAEQDTRMMAVALECIEDLGRIPAFVESFIAGAAEEGVSLTEAEARCAIDALADTAGTTAIADCLDRATDDSNANYGDDEVLDLLWDACDAGNNQACDELHLTSPLGSGYEDFARTCGGRLTDSPEAGCFDELG